MSRLPLEVLARRFLALAVCCIGATGSAACLDEPLYEDAAIDAGIEARGSLALVLNTSDTPAVQVLAVRVVNIESGETVEVHTVDLTREALDFHVQLLPGDYIVRLRAVTAQSQVCTGSGRFRIDPQRIAAVDVSVACDPAALAVGKAKLTIATTSGEVIGSTLVDIDQDQIASSSFVQLPPGRYVVWVTASTLEGQPCAGSMELVVEGGVSTAVGVDVLCER